MDTEPQRVVVIVDASKDVYAKAIKMALKKICPQQGDELILIAILDHFKSPRFKLGSFRPGDNSSVTEPKLNVGYQMSVNISQINATTKKIVEEELARKKDEYPKSSGIMKLREYCGKTKMEFIQIDVVACPFIEVACDAARNLGATWLIIDRQVNKEKKQLLRLPCGMYRIRSDNTIEKLRDPEVSKQNSKSHPPRQTMEMITGNPDVEISPKRHRSSPSELASSSSLHQIMKDKEREKVQNIEQETATIFHVSDHHEQQKGDNEASKMETRFTNPLCSVCNNKRPKVGWRKDFSYPELHKATQGFSQKNFLSEGGFGAVYKAEFNGVAIAVKKLKNASAQGEKEFKAEVNLLSRATHENVVMLLGSCSEGKHRLLVYEYVCNGSLDQHLSQHCRSPLSWEERIKVAVGVAKGLLYLHENNIIHRDVRPNNILITHDRQTLLGDFGLARNQHEDSIHSTEVIGTLGYLAPEYAEYGKVSAKIDVYSFGVVLLELITGMRPTDKRLKGKSLVGWARPLLKDRKYHGLIDKRIINSHDVHQLFWMVRIAERCLSRDPQKRLNMSGVVNALCSIEEGNTCIIPKGHSPAGSESFFSSSDFDESEGDDQEAFESEGELESLSRNSSSYDSFDMEIQLMGRHPSSPPIFINA